MRPYALGIVALACALAACSGSGGSGSTIQPMPVPSPSATPSPRVTMMPSATPSPSATPTPSISPSPTSSPAATAPPTTGVTACTSANSTVPGTYISLQTLGVVTGNTYLQSPGDTFNSYRVLTYTAPGATPGPTPSPIPSPTSVPSGSPVLYTTYFGEYNIPVLMASMVSINPTNGCFAMVTGQPAGGTAGQSLHRPVPNVSTVPQAEAAGYGSPLFMAPQPSATQVAQGLITSFTITNLTLNSGSGVFALDDNLTGTVTITGSTSSIILVAPMAVRPRQTQRTH